jgi:hypothetical protein
MQIGSEILSRLAGHLPFPKDIFADQEKFEEHLFRSGLKATEEKPTARGVFKN